MRGLVPRTHVFTAGQGVDGRDTSAYTRVLRRAMRGHDDPTSLHLVSAQCHHAAPELGAAFRFDIQRAGFDQKTAPRRVLHVVVVHRGFRKLVSQRRQMGDHVLDLLGGQNRLSLERGRDARKTLDPVIGRHDRVRVEAAGIDNPQAQLAF